jgi:hypothetical protein
MKPKNQDEPSLQMVLAALCNAGGQSGLREIHELLRLGKVSMRKGRAFDRIRRSWLCWQRAAKTLVKMPEAIRCQGGWTGRRESLGHFDVAFTCYHECTFVLKLHLSL